MPIIQDTQEADIWRIEAQVQLEQKAPKIPSQPIAGCGGIYACHPWYMGGINRRLQLRYVKARDPVRKLTKQKGLGAWLK
jgi:hypothetical protein